MLKNILFFLCLLHGALYSQDFAIIFAPIVDRAQYLADSHARNPELPKPIIAITGGSAVGKSYFTKSLARLLKKNGVKVKILKHDDFFQPERVENYLIHPHFDHRGLHLILQQIHSGAEHIQKPIWDHEGPVSYKEEITECFWDIDLILFEGIYTLCDSATYDFLHYSALRIFIDADEEDICRWNWERELKLGEKARSKEKFDADTAWDMEDYRKTVVPTRSHADFIVHKYSNHTYDLRAQ